VGGMTALAGVLVLAFPIALFGANFSAAYAYVQAKEA